MSTRVTKLSASKLRAIINEEVDRLLENLADPSYLEVGQVRILNIPRSEQHKFKFNWKAFEVVGTPGWSNSLNAGVGGLNFANRVSPSVGPDINNSTQIVVQPGFINTRGFFEPTGMEQTISAIVVKRYSTAIPDKQ